MATENRAIGGDKQPVHVDKSGKIVPLTGNAGSVTNDNLQPIYLLNGELVALTGTSGAYNKPVRVENGVIKPITVTAGNGGDRLIYLDQGEITNSSKTVGDTNKPVYLKNGVVTQISGNIGSSIQPVFISNGVITGASGDTGSDTKPLKMSGGKLTPVTKDLATVEYVESAKTAAVTEATSKLKGRETFYDGTWVFLNYNKHRLYTGVESMTANDQKITTISDGMFGVSGTTSKGARWYTLRRQNGNWEGQRGIVADFVTSIAAYALYDAYMLSQMYCPECKSIGKWAMHAVDMMCFSRFYMPKLEKIDDHGLRSSANTDMWEASNMHIVYLPKLRYMGYYSFYDTYYIKEFNVGMQHVITTTDEDRAAIKDYVLNGIPSNYTEGIRNLNANNVNVGNTDECYLYKGRFKTMVNAGRISVCDMYRTTAGLCTKLNFPTMQFFMYCCCYNYRNVTSINIKEAILIDYQAFMYLSYDKPSSPLYIDIQKCLYIGRDAFEDAYISGIRADELVRVGWSAFEMRNAPGQGSFQHLYAPKLQIIDATGFQYCYSLKDSKYSEDGGSTWIGTNDTIELPECRWIKQHGLWGHNAVTIKLPKCTKLGDSALYDHNNQRLRHVYLDAMDATSLVANQLEAPSADDRGIYYSINGGSRPNVTIHCKNGKTVKWNSSTSRWYVAS